MTRSVYDECHGEDALWCWKILTCLRLDLRSVALAACDTAHPVQTVSDDVQSNARICACIIYPNSASSPALKVALGHLFVATWWSGGREQSSVNAHLSSRIRRHGTITVLHPQLFIREQFQDGSENISVCI